VSASPLRKRVTEHRHTTLLVAIVTLFALRPLIGDSQLGPLAFSVTVLVVLLLALYAIRIDELVGEPRILLAARRRRDRVAWGLAMLAIIERVAMVVVQNRKLTIVGSVCWLMLLCFVLWNLWQSILRQKDVTGETISLAISIYLLFGLTWGILYAVIFEFQPQAFSFGGAPFLTGAASNDPRQVFPVFIYFSLTTLSTIGYGDITPVTLQARYAAVAEGITGQLYLAILVARLVGISASRKETT